MAKRDTREGELEPPAPTRDSCSGEITPAVKRDSATGEIVLADPPEPPEPPVTRRRE